VQVLTGPFLPPLKLLSSNKLHFVEVFLLLPFLIVEDIARQLIDI
jgi:hypothetical protein